jgi:hypothetical protein
MGVTMSANLKVWHGAKLEELGGGQRPLAGAGLAGPSRFIPPKALAEKGSGHENGSRDVLFGKQRPRPIEDVGVAVVKGHGDRPLRQRSVAQANQALSQSQRSAFAAQYGELFGKAFWRHAHPVRIYLGCRDAMVAQDHHATV